MGEKGGSRSGRQSARDQNRRCKRRAGDWDVTILSYDVNRCRMKFSEGADHGRRLDPPMPRYAPSSNTAEKGTRLKPAGVASPGFATRGRDLVGWAVASLFQS